MREKLIHAAGERTFVLVFDTGDEPVELLTAFARDHGITCARFTGIGAFDGVELGYFDWGSKTYTKIPIREQVEVVSLIGDIALGDDGPKVHGHVVVGRSDGTAHGGHLLAAKVRPTLEVVLVESPAHLRRRHDPVSGLALIDPDA